MHPHISALDFYAMAGVEVIVGLNVNNYFNELPKSEIKSIEQAAVNFAKDKRTSGDEVDKTSQLHNLATQAHDINQLHGLIANCKEHLFTKIAGKAVLGIGNPQADILVVGDSPTEADEGNGYAFSDVAGQLLTRMLKTININLLEDCFVTNLINWRTPAGANLTSQEIKTYLPLLERIIFLQQPKIIISLGNSAANSLCSQNLSINQLRAEPLIYQNAQLFTSYHPNILLKNPMLKKNAWADLMNISSNIIALKGQN
jgi:uracil-DNA glycosylase